MKKLFLIFCLVLLCCSAYAESETNEIDLVDEWVAFPYLERQCYIGKEDAGHYFIGEDEVAVTVEEDTVHLFIDGDDAFSGACILNDEKSAILTANGDKTHVVFATRKNLAGDEANSWRVYFLEGETEVLFTPSCLIAGNSSYEYVLKNNRLFVMQDNSYSKGIVEAISDDAFVLKLEADKDASDNVPVGNRCVLFIRSSLI